jgi:cell division protein FtsB
MSEDPGVCRSCHEAKVRAKHKQPRINWEEVTASTSGSLGGKLGLIKNFAYPHEYEDDSYCANINCTDDRENIPDEDREDGQENISDEIDKVNKGLKHAAQIGDWTGVNKEDLERLEQLSEHATEVADVVDIDWLDNEKTKSWGKIQDRIDEFEQNTGEAIDRTAEVDHASDAKVHGEEKIPECRSTLENLDGLRHSIYVQEVVVDNINRIAERETEQAVVVDEGPAISENEEDEQEEHDETDQTPDEESTETLKERIEKLETENEDLTEENEDLKTENKDLEAENENLTRKLSDRDETVEDLKEKNEDLETENNELLDEKRDLIDEIRTVTDEKRELVDENHGLTKDIMELQQELQQLQANTQQQTPERESDATATTSERASAGNGAANPGANGGHGSEADASESSPSDLSTEAPPENNQAGASANGDSESLSKAQRWVRNPDAEKPEPIPEQYEQLFGEPLPEEARNGGTENTGPSHEDERDGRDNTDQERDDDTPAGGPTF